MFIPFIFRFKITLSNDLLMKYFSQVIMCSPIFLLCKFSRSNNNIIYNFIYFSLHSTQRISLAFVNFCFNQICLYTLILSHHYKAFRLPFQISNLKPSPTLITSYFFNLSPPNRRTFSSQSSNLFSFFDLFKTIAASKPSILSPIGAYINPSSLP